MAIKVNGTTVIDDSRNLSNVGGLKTVNGTNLVGSGNISAGASTTFGAVGTYIIGRPLNTSHYATNATASGLYSVQGNSQSIAPYVYDSSWYYTNAATSVSGTWRAMTGTRTGGSPSYGLWVRIS
jgi:hypothetical protein